jgi:hypothetical protein
MDDHARRGGARRGGAGAGDDTGTARHYEFRVSGLLSASAQHALAEFSASSIEEVPPQTVIHADVIDHSQLQGFIALLDNLGLRLVSVQSTSGEPVDDTRRDRGVKRS